MKKYNQLFMASLVLGSITSGAAFSKPYDKSYDDRWYVAPTLSYLRLDDDRLSSRNGFGGAFGVGKAVSEEFNIELKGLYQNYRKGSKPSESAYSWESFGAQIDTQYYFSRNDFSPYLVAGVGAINSNVHGKNNLGFIGDAGVGIAYKVNEYFSLRSDVRYRYNKNSNNNLVANSSDEYSDMVVNFGLVIPLGKSGFSSSSKNDHASVTNLDDDNDGVKNSADLCPDSRRGAKVNSNGCESMSLRGVNFEVNSAKLTASAAQTLNKVAQDLKNSSRSNAIEIQGHTSSDGNKEMNMSLSQERAQAVVDYLKKQGVSNEMTAKGYGSEKPIADESSKEGRLKNRRVELVWQ